MYRGNHLQRTSPVRATSRSYLRGTAVRWGASLAPTGARVEGSSATPDDPPYRRGRGTCIHTRAREVQNGVDCADQEPMSLIRTSDSAAQQQHEWAVSRRHRMLHNLISLLLVGGRSRPS